MYRRLRVMIDVSVFQIIISDLRCFSTIVLIWRGGKVKMRKSAGRGRLGVEFRETHRDEATGLPKVW